MTKIEGAWKEFEKEIIRRPRGPHNIPIIIDFTGEVNIVQNGKALTIGVLKTEQFSMACKGALHITIAYHASKDFQDNIIENIERWLHNLRIHQRVRLSEKVGCEI